MTAFYESVGDTADGIVDEELEDAKALAEEVARHLGIPVHISDEVIDYFAEQEQT